MYFNNNKGETNIDAEFENKKSFDLKKFKIPLIIIGISLLLAVIIVIVTSNGSKEEFIELKGKSEMTIYKGDSYTEPGYMAFDNKRRNLTKKVTIVGTVDTNTIGTYTITYSLPKITKTRTVNVIKKSEGITYIHLKNNTTIHISKGEEYIEPGYIAIDDIDGDITNQVITTGQVDTTKEGIYRKNYTVTNSIGKTTTVTRVIIVE